MKLSIIIPVYNISAYLEECVQSVLRQTFTDYEVILVDDGSTDGSSELCDEIAQQENKEQRTKNKERIRVIHKENGGLSDARNAGLRAAQGEYIHFLDGDDYYTTDRDLEILVDALYTLGRPDILLFCRRDVYEYKSAMPKKKAANAETKDGEAISQPTGEERQANCKPATQENYVVRVHDENPYDIEYINNCESVTEIFRHLLMKQRFNMSACFQLLRREMLIENEVFFTKGLRNEDIDWSLALWQKVQSVKAINCPAYTYRHRSDSITTTYQWRDIESYEYMFNKWVPILEQRTKNKEQRTEKEDLAQLQLSYLAFIYPTLVYAYYFLPKEDRERTKEAMRKMSNILQYSTTKKPLRIKRCMQLLGFDATLHIFASYRMIRLCGIREWWRRK